MKKILMGYLLNLSKIFYKYEFLDHKNLLLKLLFQEIKKNNIQLIIFLNKIKNHRILLKI